MRTLDGLIAHWSDEWILNAAFFALLLAALAWLAAMRCRDGAPRTQSALIIAALLALLAVPPLAGWLRYHRLGLRRIMLFRGADGASGVPADPAGDKPARPFKAAESTEWIAVFTPPVRPSVFAGESETKTDHDRETETVKENENENDTDALATPGGDLAEGGGGKPDGAALASLRESAAMIAPRQSTAPRRSPALERSFAPEPPAAGLIVPEVIQTGPDARSAPAGSLAQSSQSAQSAHPARRGWLWALRVFGLLWLAGIVLQLCRLAADLLRIRRLKRQLVPQSSPVVLAQWRALTAGRPERGLPKLCELPGTQPPFAAGLLRPMIVLPRAAAERLSAGEIRAILAHEWAHLRTGDLWIALLGQVALAAHWWNPFVRLLNRRLRLAREILCDGAAAAESGGARNYARCLVALLEKLPAAGALPAPFAAHAALELERRIKSILKGNGKMEPRLQPGKTCAIFCSVAAITLCSMSCLNLGFAGSGAAEKPASDPAAASTAFENPADPIPPVTAAELTAEEQQVHTTPGVPPQPAGAQTRTIPAPGINPNSNTAEAPAAANRYAPYPQGYAGDAGYPDYSVQGRAQQAPRYGFAVPGVQQQSQELTALAEQLAQIGQLSEQLQRRIAKIYELNRDSQLQPELSRSLEQLRRIQKDVNAAGQLHTRLAELIIGQSVQEVLARGIIVPPVVLPGGDVSEEEQLRALELGRKLESLESRQAQLKDKLKLLTRKRMDLWSQQIELKYDIGKFDMLVTPEQKPEAAEQAARKKEEYLARLNAAIVELDADIEKHEAQLDALGQEALQLQLQQRRSGGRRVVEFEHY